MSDLWTGGVEVTVTFQFEYDIDEGWEARGEDHVIELVTAEIMDSIKSAWLGQREHLYMTLTRDEVADRQHKEDQ